MQTQYRENGAIGALLDEYERSIHELKSLLMTISDTDLATIVDNETNDEDCRSIQSIMAHVIRAGYVYVIVVRKHLGENLAYPERIHLGSGAAFCAALDEMFRYNVQLFSDYPNLEIEEYDNTKKIVVSWGQSYDVEQLFEHAIVHILRHRRQIERFLLKLR